MQKPENPRNPTRPEFFGFSNFWPEKPEILLSETRPEPDPKIRVRVFSRVSRVSRTMLPTLPTHTHREVWKNFAKILLLLLLLSCTNTAAATARRSKLLLFIQETILQFGVRESFGFVHAQYYYTLAYQFVPRLYWAGVIKQTNLQMLLFHNPIWNIFK